VPAFQDREITKDDIAAVLESDRLVANAIGQNMISVSRGQVATPDEARAGDAEIMKILSPHEGVVPVIVAEVLIGIPRCLGFRSVVFSAVVAGTVARFGTIGGKDRGALGEIKIDVALQMNRKAHVGSGGKENRPSACCGSSFDREIDRRGIDRFSVPSRSEGTHIEARVLRA
jgi:hypothetical protein